MTQSKYFLSYEIVKNFGKSSVIIILNELIQWFWFKKTTFFCLTNKFIKIELTFSSKRRKSFKEKFFVYLKKKIRFKILKILKKYQNFGRCNKTSKFFLTLIGETLNKFWNIVSKIQKLLQHFVNIRHQKISRLNI